MVATSLGKTPHDYSSPSSSVRLNDTDVGLYLHSGHQSESEPHTGSIPTDVSLHKSGLKEIKRHDTTTEPETAPTQHYEPNQSEKKQSQNRCRPMACQHGTPVEKICRDDSKNHSNLSPSVGRSVGLEMDFPGYIGLLFK